MCGLLGFIDYSRNVSLEKFNKAIDTMQLRGPDARGAKVHNNEKYNIGLGHRRLSIIDLEERANQPFYSDNLGIIYNGEIYNYASIKKELENLKHNFKTTSDTEVILKAYKEWGAACVEKFLGMFAIAIYDKSSNEIILFRDRLGVKPLYLYQEKDLFVFSSDSISIYKLLNKQLEIDKSALNGFFSLGYIPALYSIFKKVSKVKPGNIVTIDLKSRKTKIKQYWDLKNYIKEKDFKESDKNKLKELLADAAKLRLVSDVEVGSYLSGGLDSSYVTKLLTDHSNQKLKTFTIGFDTHFDEAPHAKEVAKLIGTEHSTYYLKAKDISEILLNYALYFNEPFADNTAIPMLYLSQNSKKQVKVVVSSDGGDELFAGYYQYLKFLKHNNSLKRIPKLLRLIIKPILKLMYTITPQNYNLKSLLWKLKNIINTNSNIQLYNLLFFGSRISYPILKKVIEKEILKQNFDNSLDFETLNNTSDLKKMLYADINETLVNKMLVKVDKSTMGASIEAREPLLDHRLFEYMFSFSEKNFINNRVTKYQFREVINEEFKNNKLLQKSKKSFETPLLKWLKQNYSEYVEEELNSIYNLKIPYLNQANLLKLWESYDKIQSNKKELIWRSLVFIQWYKTHILQIDTTKL